ncbi:hypothetical protein P3S67_020742 [Capsicum chacoense]
MEEHVAAGILNAKTNWRDYCINIKDFAAYLIVSSNTSGSTTKDLFTDVMDELEKQEITASSKWEDCKSLFGDRQVASFAFIDLELVTRLQGPLESDN